MLPQLRRNSKCPLQTGDATDLEVKMKRDADNAEKGTMKRIKKNRFLSDSLYPGYHPCNPRSSGCFVNFATLTESDPVNFAIRTNAFTKRNASPLKYTAILGKMKRHLVWHTPCFKYHCRNRPQPVPNTGELIPQRPSRPGFSRIVNPPTIRSLTPQASEPEDPVGVQPPNFDNKTRRAAHQPPVCGPSGFLLFRCDPANEKTARRRGLFSFPTTDPYFFAAGACAMATTSTWIFVSMP